MAARSSAATRTDARARLSRLELADDHGVHVEPGDDDGRPFRAGLLRQVAPAGLEVDAAQAGAGGERDARRVVRRRCAAVDAELDQLISFYSSGIGAKYFKERAALDRQEIDLASEWSDQIAPKVLEKVRANMNAGKGQKR